MSCPSSITLPAVIAGLSSRNSPMTARDVMLLPQPDSPTRPRISPLPISNETFETILAKGRGAPSDTVRLRTLSMALSPGLGQNVAQSGIKPVAQRVADQVERECCDDDRKPRKQQQPRRTRDEDARFGEHVSPTRNFRRSAETEEVK